MPVERTISQGYVYGLENVSDYTGVFYGVSVNALSNMYGGAVASPKVYAELVGGTGCTPSVGVSKTYYITGQSDWVYGKANMDVVSNPYRRLPFDSSPIM